MNPNDEILDDNFEFEMSLLNMPDFCWFCKEDFCWFEKNSQYKINHLKLHFKFYDIVDSKQLERFLKLKAFS